MRAGEAALVVLQRCNTVFVLERFILRDRVSALWGGNDMAMPRVYEELRRVVNRTNAG